jgi:catechol 2,3-dioxygenase-like lactoylglutathione lyase family enzyme
MNWTLELVLVPVADIDRAKAFYMDQIGFDLDVDHSAGDFRVVQLTPPGSACSISLLRNPPMEPGSLQGLHLVVPDIEAARAQLIERGAEPSELYHFAAGGQLPGPDPDRRDYNTYMAFNDPDGNGWLVQEVPSRASGA